VAVTAVSASKSKWRTDGSMNRGAYAQPVAEPITMSTSDGETLEGELARAEGDARATCVLCHPHPQAGGSMRSLVISELFRALPPAGITTVRFNFRGVEQSTGAWTAGEGERRDVTAAVDLGATLEHDRPLVLAGWSFGADLALATTDDRIAGWYAIAAPLRYTTKSDITRIAAVPRPKLLALAEHDEVRPATEVAELATSWTDTDVVVVPGASHFFVGRTDRLVALALEFADRVIAAR
jgi:alpha/beta superfamily hydrolase